MRPSNVSEPLEAAAAAIVEAQGGIWRKGGALCRCPAHQDKTPSLSVRVGDTSILFKCFAGCTAREVIQALRRASMTIPAEIARQRFGNSSPGLDHGPKARFLWDQAYVIDVGRGVEYLRGRGIGAGGPSLRFHPAVPLGRGRRVRFRPALLAAVVERDRLIAVQRIFLDTRLQALAPDLDEPRLLLGRPRKGAVRLEEPGAVLGLAEGVETALSASLLLRIPVWATLGSERLAAIDIPSCVRRLVLLPDADHAGVRAERRARSAYRALGLQTETRWPWFGLKDWNDVLRKEGRGM